MRITESRLRKIIRSVIKESFVLPPSQKYDEEGEKKVKNWLKTKKGQHWWEQVNTNDDGQQVKGIEINITNKHLEKNNILFRDAKPVCLLTGKKLQPGVVVKIQPEGGYSTIGYVEKEHCKKYAFDLLGNNR